MPISAALPDRSGGVEPFQRELRWHSDVDDCEIRLKGPRRGESSRASTACPTTSVVRPEEACQAFTKKDVVVLRRARPEFRPRSDYRGLKPAGSSIYG